MGCGASKPNPKDRYSKPYQCDRHGCPVDKKTLKKYEKAYIKKAKRDRRRNYAAVNMSGANMAFVGYVIEQVHECKVTRKTIADRFDRGGGC
jgi:hypothetical protein